MSVRYITPVRYSFYEDFSGAAGSVASKPLATGATSWQTVGFPTNDGQINLSGNGTAIQSLSSGNARSAWFDCQSPNPKLFARVGQQTGGLTERGRIIFNMVDTSNFWGFTPSGSVNGDYILFSVTAGATTVRQTGSLGIPKANGDVWQVEVNGDVVYAWVNGRQVINFYALNRPHKQATRVGIGFGSSTPIAASFDEFGVYNNF